ncbi:unnamed protein product, partial [Ectocarpus sp. 12 AP-2014]
LQNNVLVGDCCCCCCCYGHCCFILILGAGERIVAIVFSLGELGSELLSGVEGSSFHDHLLLPSRIFFDPFGSPSGISDNPLSRRDLTHIVRIPPFPRPGGRVGGESSDARFFFTDLYSRWLAFSGGVVYQTLRPRGCDRNIDGLFLGLLLAFHALGSCVLHKLLGSRQNLSSRRIDTW